MVDQSEFKCRSSLYCSSSCILNDFSEILSSDKQIQSSHSYQKYKDVLCKNQETIAIGGSCEECLRTSEPLCHVKLESLNQLKESTKQLLFLLEEIQSKTLEKNSNETAKFTNLNIKSFSQDYITNEIFDTEALKKLGANAKKLNGIYIKDDHDKCSVYRRLTRQCHCLNHPDYNDFVIHFNEDSKYTTSNLGEIIKNMRILRKFLYMGGNYTRNALMFLNEGMMESPHSERVEMSQACANADVCNIFEDHSFVIILISWPCKNKHYGDYVTQALAAGFLYKLAQIEDGRRYLKYSSKITNDIKKVLRKKGTLIEVDTLESLNATLDLLKPVFNQNLAVTSFSKCIYEGIGKKTICDLVNHRKYMTFDEILMQLSILDSYSEYDSGRTELTLHLPLVLLLFKHLLMEYDNNEINITVTSILNSIITKNILKEKESFTTKGIELTERAVQVMEKMISEECQFPPKKASSKKINKSKLGLGCAPSKFRQSSKRQVSEWEPSSLRTLNRSKKFHGEQAKKSIIIVPMDK